MKMATAASITGRRPNASASRPERGRIVVHASPYADPTQTYLCPPPRSFVIVGSAVAIAVTSSALTNVQTMMAKNESQNAESLRNPV